MSTNDRVDDLFETVLSSLDAIVEIRETIMATIADLTAAAQALTDGDHALAAEVGVLTTAVTSLRALYDALVAKGGLSAADQTALDAAVTSVTTASTDLATQTATLAADQTKATP
jgi:hypothetical protein